MESKKFDIDSEYQYKFDNSDNKWHVWYMDKMLPDNTDSPLYRFSPLNMYSIDGLLRNYFYLANPADFNDPFDCNVNLISNISESIIGERRVEDVKSVKRNNYSNIGVTSFSETIDNHLMWAHYTANYYGFAIEFKGDNISVELNKEVHSRCDLARVIYPEKLARIKNNSDFAQHYVLTVKNKHWSYEKEWRILADITNNKRELRYVSDRVKGLYIGHKIPDIDKGLYRMLLEIAELKFPQAPIYVVYPHPTELRLEIEKVWN